MPVQARKDDNASAPNTDNQNKNFYANIKKITRPVYDFPIIPHVKVNFPYQNLPDYDRDGFPDKYDMCPGVKGIYNRRGCPAYDLRKIVTYARPKIGVSQADYMITVNAFSSLEFDDKQKLLPSCTANLDTFIAFMKRRKDCTIVISAHVDETRSNRMNKFIAEDRLESIIGYLAKKGIASNRVTANAFGDNMPVVDLPATRFEVEINSTRR